MPILYVLQGLPGSGKSTKARQLIEDNPEKGYVRVNQDSLREMTHIERKSWSEDKEMAIRIIKFAAIEALLAAGHSVISDDTNLRESVVDSLRNIAERYGAQLIIHMIDTPLDVCVKQDAQRPAPVGEDVIRGMWERYQEALAVNQAREVEA